MVKRTILTFVVALTGCLAAMAQNYEDCPQFKNPTSFVTGADDYFWTGRAGERTYTSGNYNDTTTGSHIMSTCTGAPDIPATSITSSSYNSGVCGLLSGCSHTFWDTNGVRFQIIGTAQAGKDQFTVNSPTDEGMQRIPSGYSSCIRLGDMHCTGDATTTKLYNASSSNRGSEALFYTMYVTTQNALLFINYAIVARRYDHDAYDAGEFLIRVVKQVTDANGNTSWEEEPINDSLWYKVSAPHHTGTITFPWVAGRNGSWPCTYTYKPWTKVAINLNQYLYTNVRIEMYTSDCIYDADPLYAYICGDFQPMEVVSSGCPGAESDVIDTLTAPSGMISYQWYVSTTGAAHSFYGEDIDTLNFRPLTGVITDDNHYTPRVSDFILTEGAAEGDTVAEQTFMCVMYSAMDPSKPFSSKLYANVENRKPLIRFKQKSHCDKSVTFVSNTKSFSTDGLNHEATYWVAYSDTTFTTVLDTIYGDSVDYTFPAEGYYGMKLYCETAGDVCAAEETFHCRALANPPVNFTCSSHIICDGDTVTFTCTEGTEFEKVWTIDDSVYTTADTTGNTLRTVLPKGDHTIKLTTITPDSCSSVHTETVRVYGIPILNLDATESAICLGQSLTIHAAGNISYSWHSTPVDSSLLAQEGMSTITVSPQVTTTYYLSADEDNPCSNEGAYVKVEVIPYPVPTVKTNVPNVSFENAIVTFSDISLYGDHTTWAFSDGMTDEGTRVTHSFSELSGDSVSITMHTCNRLDCCSDTTFSMPIETFSVWFPNVFTPELETSNKYFGLVTTQALQEYEIFIYNRAGMLVHQSTDYNDRWDGTDLNGNPCPQGAYVYFYRYMKDNLGAWHPGNGTVTLIR